MVMLVLNMILILDCCLLGPRSPLIGRGQGDSILNSRANTERFAFGTLFFFDFDVVIFCQVIVVFVSTLRSLLGWRLLGPRTSLLGCSRGGSSL